MENPGNEKYPKVPQSHNWGWIGQYIEKPYQDKRRDILQVIQVIPVNTKRKQHSIHCQFYFVQQFTLLKAFRAYRKTNQVKA